MAKTVTMSDIAEELGVSTVTVSKALSNQKGVSDSMRAKIKELAEQMGADAYTETAADCASLAKELIEKQSEVAEK